ncbi:hypothetical protein [Acinetobacter sp. YH01006]|uniref:hypothetical protein n=2 Tax=Moraxellaceae TaxID=468 RepID=UPI0015D2C2CF|nr:hypothetical protein [Acinetobacter sp. YH01006]
MWKASRQLHELAERITAHKTPLNSGDLSGVFLFLLVVRMDVKEAQKNLNELHDELVKYQNLSRAFMNSKQMMAIDEVMANIRTRMKNIQINLSRR